MTDQSKLKELATEYIVDHGAYDEDHSLLRLLIRIHNESREEALAGTGQKITYFHEKEE